MRNPDGVEFTLILFMLALGFIIFWSLGIPFIADHMVGENATWIFHNEIVEEKWIEQYKEKIQKVSPAKNPKNAKKGKEPVKSENVVENNDIKKLNKILRKIIAILVDLFSVVKNYRKINNK